MMWGEAPRRLHTLADRAKPGLRGGIPVCTSQSTMADLGLFWQLTEKDASHYSLCEHRLESSHMVVACGDRDHKEKVKSWAC